MKYSQPMALSISDLHSLTNSFIETVKSAYEKLMSKIFKSPSNILFLGIDNAGKTTLAQKLKNNVNNVFLPTHNSSYEKIEIGNLKAIIVDIGGHATARRAWKDYFFNVDGVVFLVDVSDTERYEEVSEAWRTVMENEKKAPIIVIMNKIDALNYNTQTIESDFGFRHYIESVTKISEIRNPNQNVKVSYHSIIKEDVFKSDTPIRLGLDWLSQNIKK
jgi:GTP-binding protein SAR1